MTTLSMMDMVDEFCPVPFPENLPVIELEKISFAKLLNNDEAEAHRVFEICTREGFFYLDLMDHPKGIKLMEAASLACRTGKESLGSISMEEKRKYKALAHVGIIDAG
jgi:hypothetical protein